MNLGNWEEILTRILWVGALGAALGACAGGASLDSRSTAVTVASDLPAPDETELGMEMTEYRIGPTDVIAVSVFNADELETEGMVDAGGNFLLPLIGTVRAGGKTPSELSNAIADELRGRFIKDPQVVVNVKEARARTVTVDGAVMQPGIYPVVGKMSLQQAIATARGVNDLADTDTVILFRTVDGQRMAALYDLDDIRSGRIVDPQVYGRDVVVVGQSATRRFMKDTQMAAPIFARFLPVY